MYTWNQIIANLIESGVDSVARVPVHQMQHPRDAGAQRTFGGPYGQRSSYRAAMSDGRTLCIEEFGATYEARIESFAAPASPASPSSTGAVETIAGLTALGALLGLALGGKKENALTGALFGGVSGLATVAVAEAGRSPETSKAALEVAKAMTALFPFASTNTSGSTKALPPVRATARGSKPSSKPRSGG